LHAFLEDLECGLVCAGADAQRARNQNLRVLVSEKRQKENPPREALVLIRIFLMAFSFYSTGKRASGSLMEILLQFVGNVDGLGRRIVKQNQEELYISATALEDGATADSAAAKSQRQAGNTSKLFCYPCSGQ